MWGLGTASEESVADWFDSGWSREPEALAHVQFQVVDRLRARLRRQSQALLDEVPGEQPGEARMGGRRIAGAVQRGLRVDDLLDRAEGIGAEGGDPPREPVDDRVQFGVGDGAVDPAVPGGRVGVVVLTGGDDLQGPGTAR
ncbi:hypothetical protein ACZ91_36305 [Streptomyces regensis]|uniref:hypothetical protein n=1 Tax=Streptomyces flaveus TaxID=66370 RepID=UPI0004BD25F6|nr:hypothetical protein [Streptomyces flaveus]KMS86549.1 hypothetical protein ACZ91_36305 [Streptomyces regensis]KOG60225.1 hypothetical protein ADK77_36515 [Streptomyces antibioticus]